ncbi:MAG: hypothetical protein JO326_01295 [Acetobacteraceae bacterium]|nr:hypothetical protein [Acetobacteraceae bacterium]
MSKFDRMRERCATKPHGTRARYVSGCKCLQCRAANSRYSCEAQRRHDSGDTGNVIDASEAREHLRWLSRRGVGRRAVADASGVSATILHQIKLGKRRRIRASTARRILRVDAGAAWGKALVSARRTWQLLNSLIERGYTKGQLSLWLGNKTAALQINHKKVTAETAQRVERLYKLIEAGRLMRGAPARTALGQSDAWRKRVA